MVPVKPRATLPSSPIAVEQGGYDVVHFAAQAGERTALPNLYQPWDLQHLRFPDLFSAGGAPRGGRLSGPCCRSGRASRWHAFRGFVRAPT